MADRDDPRAPRALGKLLSETLGKKGLLETKRRMDRVRRAWNEVADDATAEQTRVRSLRRGVLSIDAASAALAHELAAFHKTALLRALTERFPELEIDDLHFRQGDLSAAAED